MNFFDNYKSTANQVFNSFTNKAQVPKEKIADINIEVEKIEKLAFETAISQNWKRDEPLVSK